MAFWNPAEKPQKGQELLFGYKLYWCREIPVSSRARHGARHAHRHRRHRRPEARLFLLALRVDFAGGDFALLGEHANVVPMISASRGKVEITSARPLRELNGWRAMFDLRLTDDSVEPINLRLFLAAGWPAADRDLVVPVHAAAG